MRVNRKLQLGLILVLYLARTGRKTGEKAAKELNVSRYFLESVARLLRLKGIVSATKGPKGGYDLVGSPTVGDIFNALSPVQMLTAQERALNVDNGNERRTLNRLAVNLTYALTPAMNQKVRVEANKLNG